MTLEHRLRAIVRKIESNGGLLTLQHSIALDETEGTAAEKIAILEKFFKAKIAEEKSLLDSINILHKWRRNSIKTMTSIGDYIAILEKR